jgi:hypothetical protein
VRLAGSAHSRTKVRTFSCVVLTAACEAVALDRAGLGPTTRAKVTCMCNNAASQYSGASPKKDRLQ